MKESPTYFLSAMHGNLIWPFYFISTYFLYHVPCKVLHKYSLNIGKTSEKLCFEMFLMSDLVVNMKIVMEPLRNS